MLTGTLNTERKPVNRRRVLKENRRPGLLRDAAVLPNPHTQVRGKFLYVATTATEQHAVKQQDQDCACDRGDEACRFAGSVPAELLSDEARQERAADTQQRGDDEAAGIIPWH